MSFKALVITKFGDLDELQVMEIKKPKLLPDQVLIKTLLYH